MTTEKVSNDLVSIIMPAYNCSDFITEAIKSVINQTYIYWELIIIDDHSTDDTFMLARNFEKKDSRIRVFRHEKNKGAAMARNKGIDLVKGNYIAFLDSDDLWFNNKLDEQIGFMKANKYTFTCTGYSKIDENGNDLNKEKKTIPKSDYEALLKECPGNSTVIYNVNVLGKFYIEDIKKRNDYLMWLQVIKESKHLYGLNKTLSSHRIRTGSISKNKFSLVKYHWIVYRHIEKLSITKSVYLIMYWINKKLINK